MERDGSVVFGGRRWDFDWLGLLAEEVELRTFHDGRHYGCFMLQPTTGVVPSQQARLVAVTLADQVGATLDNRDT